MKQSIIEIYAQIGEKFYEMDPSDTDYSQLRVLCDDIDTRKRRIKKMIFSANNMRGYKICPQCKAEENGSLNSAVHAELVFLILKMRSLWILMLYSVMTRYRKRVDLIRII